MAVTLRSLSLVAATNGANAVFTKPAGLAVGDLMVAMLGGELFSRTAPAGWTNQGNQAGGSGNGNSTMFSKIADSSDVAASTFTFVGSSDSNGGTLYAFTAGTFDSANPFAFINHNLTTGQTPSWAIGGVPTANCMFIMFMQNFTTGSSPTASGYAVATSDPSPWTEDQDSNKNGGGYFYQLACAHSSIRSQITNTGNASLTIAGSASSWSGGWLVAIQPPQTAVKTINGLAKASAKTFNGLAIASVKTINGLA